MGIMDMPNVPDAGLPTRLSEGALNATYVRFVDQNGNPLPTGSLVTITVDTTTVPKRIADIVVEEI